jgi:hypothetical protein
LDTGSTALATASAHVEAGRVAPSELGRSLVTARFLTDPSRWDLRDEWGAQFDDALTGYRSYSDHPEGNFPELDVIQVALERALAATFGLRDGEMPYVAVETYDPRDPSRIFVPAELDHGTGSYDVRIDPVLSRDRDGAVLAGYRPLSITVALGGSRDDAPPGAVSGGVEVDVTLPIFRLLRSAERGTVASTADLERFYALRRAAEALARQTAATTDRLLVERPGSHRRYLVKRHAGLGGQPVVAAQELPR